tara:strand:- start:972 stop:1196 length:225 start_codon:yes stop_codon:yes gene_type:complete
MKVTRDRKKTRKQKKKSVDYSTPYEGAKGKSVSRQAAEKMWASKASRDELKLGSKTTMDQDGNYIVRTRLSSKA